jgi:putative spermidine/putrescine transport system permease protein
MSTTASEGAQERPRRQRVSSTLHRHPRLRLGLLITPPMLWLGLAYLGALGALFITSLWAQDAFTGETIRRWNLDNFRLLWESEVYRTVAFRTVGIAALVTVVDIVIAFPIALYMAKVASPRMQKILVIAVLTPLWASYLVKAYAWRIMLSENGVVHDVGTALGIDTPGYGLTAVVITLAYLWLPFMILPIYAGLERLPDSMLEASADLGARTGHSLRRVVLPTVFPAIVAGSIFTFSLSLGDYITVRIVGGANQMLGNVVYDNVGAANNLPFAAAVATIPVVIMLVYLAAARRTGALDNV